VIDLQRLIYRREGKRLMIIPEVPPVDETARTAYPQALYKRAIAAIAAFLVAFSTTLAGVTVKTIAPPNDHAASIFKLSPCGDQPGICP
jgi:hypothetical protein